MSAAQSLFYLFGINPKLLGKNEALLLEVELFLRLYQELKIIFDNQFKETCQIQFNFQKEYSMPEANFVRLVIRDILSTEEYNLIGIARYTHTNEEIIEDILLGRSHYPSAHLLRGLFELHRLSRPELYQALIKKIATQYLSEAA